MGKLITFLVIAFAGNLLAQDQEESIRNAQRANYVFNFTDYFTWPQQERLDTFKIGIIGQRDTDLLAAFHAKSIKTPVKGLIVQTNYVADFKSETDFQVYYLNNGFDWDLRPILNHCYFNNTLLITEAFPFQESMINFIDLDGDFQFDLNESKINRAQLLVDPELKSFSVQSTVKWEELYEKLKSKISSFDEQKKLLDELSNRIWDLEKRIEESESELNEKAQQIELKNERLYEQDSLIKNQKDVISSRLSKLNKLSKAISANEISSIEMANLLENQKRMVAEQNAQLDSQNIQLNNNETALDQQRRDIEKQKLSLVEKDTQIKRTNQILFGIIGFSVFALALLYLLIRANRKRMKSEKELKEKNIELVELNKSLDSFTYRVSHDLKSPIINMKSIIEMLEDTIEEEDPVVDKLFKNLNLSSNRLERTVKDMLELTRIERVTEVKELVSLKEIFEELQITFKDQLEEKGGQLDLTEIVDDQIYGSPVELKSVFQNLFTNSMKYRSDQRELRIKITCEKEDEYCRIRYSDNGKGIDLKRHQEKLFKMFQRFSSDPKVSGTGVGMYIINKLIDKNNGLIELESGIEKGLTYFISLPAFKN